MQRVKSSFLHACINHGTLTSSLVNQILEPLCVANGVDTPTNVQSFVEEINEEIRKYGQTLVFHKYAISKEEYLVFGVTYEVPGCKTLPTLSDEERKYFGLLLEFIVFHEDFCIPWQQAYDVADKDAIISKTLSKIRMQDALNHWIRQGYFFEKEEMIYFGPRMIVEFGHYLRKNFPDNVKECTLCKKLVFWDVQCSACNEKVHVNCIRKYLRTRSTCPSCKSMWTTRLSIS